MKTATPVKAISYIRFSHKSQIAGDSLRRQREWTEAYCARKGWTLDTSLSCRDLGVSAFRGKNALVGNLRTFLDAVTSGKVPSGSALIVESLDRISRQGIDEGYDVIKKILKAGIILVTLSPEREYDREAVRGLTKGALEILVTLERAAEESERKSQRIGAAWTQKRKAARESRSVVTRRLPGWIEEKDGKLRLIPQHAATVKRIFQLSARGYGQITIVKKLIDEKVPPFLGVVRHRDPENPETFIEKPGRWNRTYVKILLSDRRALGEFQLYKGDGTPDGEPIRDYFPAVITEQEWYAARAGCSARDRKQGRQGKHIELFKGLLFDAQDGGTMMPTTRMDKGRCSRVLVNTASTQGQAPCRSFPLPIFEQVVLSLLREVDLKEVLSQKVGPDSTVPALEEEVAALHERKEQLSAELLTGHVAAVAAALRQLEAREVELQARLEAARAEAAVPLASSWKEAKSLAARSLRQSLTPLDDASDREDARLRLRTALRRVVDEIWLLVAPRGRDRLCAAQVWFHGGEKLRNYRILYRTPRGNRHGKKRTPGRVWVESTRYYNSPGVIDFRKKEDAEWALEDLLAWDPERDAEEGDRFLLKGTIVESNE